MNFVQLNGYLLQDVIMHDYYQLNSIVEFEIRLKKYCKENESDINDYETIKITTYFFTIQELIKVLTKDRNIIVYGRVVKCFDDKNKYVGCGVRADEVLTIK